jgi:Tfp pilus assembly protein FimV
MTAHIVSALHQRALRRRASRFAVAITLALGAPWALGRAEAGPTPPAAAGPEAMRIDPGVVRQRVVVQPRETLDALIRRTHKGSPFRDDILRRAFVQLNPVAFERGSAHALFAGAELQVPTLADVLAVAGVALPRAPEPEARPARDGADEPRQWVRYP